MRFIDEAVIQIAGGHGGPGCISFRRETFVPRGGPDGGDGGAGGSIVFLASCQLGSLQDFRFKRVYQAPAGLHGSGANKTGRQGLDIIIQVPVGTTLIDVESEEVLIDFTSDGERWVACKGGRGGKGNAHFVSSTHQAPKFAQPGEDGESRKVRLELKLLADVGLVGFPNAGKSTLISKLSAAKPKIADYPFTTLTPHLGVVNLPDLRTFVIADIPGLIEGAHRGVGLGHRFLKHLERTRLFIHLLDGSQVLEDLTLPGLSESELKAQAIERICTRYQTLRNELGLFEKKLLDYPEILVLHKVDLLSSDPEFLEQLRQELFALLRRERQVPPAEFEPCLVSSATGLGLGDLITRIDRALNLPPES